MNLDRQTCSIQTTRSVDLQGRGNLKNGPDQLYRRSGKLYLTEDGGPSPGIYVYDGTRFLTLLEAFATRYERDEKIRGIAFSPDGTSLFFCIQEIGILFQIQRIDGLPFDNEGRRILKWNYDHKQ